MSKAKIDVSLFKARSVFVIYIAATPEQVWHALTDREFSKRYFLGSSVEVEPRVGGAFVTRLPDGRVNVRGEVVDWLPPHKLSTTWTVEWIEDMRELPACLVTYDIAAAGEAVRLTVTEAYQWDIPEEMLTGGRMGWPAILSSLKSVIETGKSLSIKMEPPKEMLDAMKRVMQLKPWLKKT